jgi:two-component system cell cycle response regulator CtrA
MRILLADNDVDVRELLLLEGFKVYVAAEGDEAVSLGKLYEFDAIVLRDAPAVIKSLRLARVKTPILVVSESNRLSDVIQAFGLGADDYVTRDDELIARVHAVVRRTRGHAVSKITAGPLTLNMDTREADVHGEPLHLTNKQFQMLELLMLRKGHVQTKEQILNALYGGMDEPEIKIIDVFICKLRQKLDRAGLASDMIETVWGRGYVIRAVMQEPTDLGEVGAIGDAFGGSVDSGEVIAAEIAMRSPSIVPAG